MIWNWYFRYVLLWKFIFSRWTSLLSNNSAKTQSHRIEQHLMLKYIMWVNRIVSNNELIKVCFFYSFQEMKLNWASSPGPQPKADTSSKYKIIQFIFLKFSASSLTGTTIGTKFNVVLALIVRIVCIGLHLNTYFIIVATKRKSMVTALDMRLAVLFPYDVNDKSAVRSSSSKKLIRTCHAAKKRSATVRSRHTELR